ncbi:threonine/serine exporter family protein, partial [Staphylococcus capitis]|uniref:threonine/serine exporter family protein n=1 Tax=Staphylococcus capitis TaxID=29388 RepID=UPI0037093AE3
SLGLGLLRDYMGGDMKEGVIMFMVSGIIGLVGGGVGYDGSKNLVLVDLRRGINRMVEVRLIGGGIGLGLLFAEEMCKIVMSGF